MSTSISSSVTSAPTPASHSSTPPSGVHNDNDSTPSHPVYSIASLSLGSCLYHDLPSKIATTARLGYQAIELYIPDFDAFVQHAGIGRHQDLLTEKDWEAVETQKDLETLCARVIGRLCASHGIFISCFQPFRDFENFTGAHEQYKSKGTLIPRLKTALSRAENHFRLMAEMNCDLLLVCSNLLPVDPLNTASSTFVSDPSVASSSSPSGSPSIDSPLWPTYRDDQIIAFTELGKLAEKYNVRVGYEALAWGTAVNRWEQVWQVVEKVNRGNVGIILDSFNQLGQQWADPSEPSGRRPIADSILTSNLKTLSSIPPSKIFLYQIADAAKPPSPIVSHPAAPSRMLWSRKTRLFPMEQEKGGYLPVQEFTSTLNRMGYRGVWSLEVFNASLEDKEEDTMERHGKRGIDGLRKLFDGVSAEKQ